MTTSRKWAELRFSVIGPLLSSPPTDHGDLARRLAELAEQSWTHPTKRKTSKFAVSTLERWYYTARAKSQDPVGALKRKRRRDAGTSVIDSSPLKAHITAQYKAHGSWSGKLHHDNLVVIAAKDPALGPCASYQTIRRYMKANGMLKKKRPKGRNRPGQLAAEIRKEEREVVSYEVTHVGSLGHLDFHHGKLRIVTDKGEHRAPICFALIDDRSRLISHIQWYLGETTEELVHGFSQAMMKRGLVRAMMTDNGAAMMSGEFTQGLSRLGVEHRPILAYSPYQNAKIESFWGTLEGRLVAMLEGVKNLDLVLLNNATQAWVEREYNVTVHSETGESPIARFMNGPTVMRPSPSLSALKAAFRIEETRTIRRGDGTISIEGVRFELPIFLRSRATVSVCYARWDLSRVDVVDPDTGTIIAPIYPLDKEKNADGRRRLLPPPDQSALEAASISDEIAPLLTKYMDDHAADGLPPAYMIFSKELHQ